LTKQILARIKVMLANMFGKINKESSTALAWARQSVNWHGRDWQTTICSA